MSRNKSKSHLFILPEDDANRQIINGFINNLNVNENAIQVLRTDGGWTKVVDKFINDHVKEMTKYPKRNILLIVDFDGREDRFSDVEQHIPDSLRNRVFILGVKSNPESLRRDIQMSFEDIGEALATDCSENTNELWGHHLLIHNQPELERMISSVKPFLFTN